MKLPATITVSSLAIASLMLFFSQAHGAKARTLTVTGTVVVAQLDSCIELPDETSICFLTDSPEGKAIFKACKVNDTCRVTGLVSGSGQYLFFTRVKKAILVKRAS